MSLHIARYSAILALLITHLAIAPVNGQCTIMHGCATGEPSIDIVEEIEKLNEEAFHQLNNQIQIIQELLTESLQEIKSLQSVDKTSRTDDTFIRQVQSFLELLNTSISEVKSLNSVDQSLQEYDIYINQVQRIRELLSKSLQEIKRLQLVDRRFQDSDSFYVKEVQSIYELLNELLQNTKGKNYTVGTASCLQAGQDTFTMNHAQSYWKFQREVSNDTYLGCYDEFGDEQVFAYDSATDITNLSSLAPDGCRERCRKDLIYSFAGLWGGSHCYCAIGLTGGQITRVNDSLCHASCPGKANKFCGGSNDSYIFSVYSVCPEGMHGRNCTKQCNCKEERNCTIWGVCPGECEMGWKMTNTTNVNRRTCTVEFSNGTYLGCYHEYGNEIVFARESATTSSSMKSSECREACRKDLKYSFAGLWRGSYCYCATQLSGQLARVNNSFYHTPCSGEPTAFCGAPDMSLYYGVYAVCPSGFYGRSCTNDCNCKEKRNCTVYGRCPGDECAVGWTLNNAGLNRRSCSIDIDECQTRCSQTESINCHNCNHALKRKCQNNIGSFKCICEDGYEETSSRTCSDIDECARGRHRCSHHCINTEGSYNCSCRSGYELRGGFYCHDIDECVRSSHGCSHQCKNTDGSYYCSCRSGYELYGNSHCRDIDECQRGSHGCSVSCANTEGCYNCYS